MPNKSATKPINNVFKIVREVVREELKPFVTKKELKKELERFATKEDLNRSNEALKDEINETFFPTATRSSTASVKL